MRLYLTRATQLAAVRPHARYFARGVWSSEIFLGASARAAKYALTRRYDWMFCQFGDRAAGLLKWRLTSLRTPPHGPPRHT